MKNLLLVFGFILPYLNVFAQTEIDKINTQNQLFSQYLVAGETEKLLAIYHDDAKIFPDQKEILTGRDSLMAYWAPNPDSKWRLVSHKLESEEITLPNEDTAIDYGYYYGTSAKRMAPAETSDWKGKYVVIWKKDKEGVWKIYLDIWNRVNE